MRILAISASHDASICVLNDGKLEFFCKEERIRRKKRCNLFVPEGNFDQAENCSLKILKDNYRDNYFDELIFLSPSHGKQSDNQVAKEILHILKNNFKLRSDKFQYFSHHLTHAYLAYVNSKFDDALVFVIDRNGSFFTKDNEFLARESESVFKFNSDGHKSLYKSYWRISDKNKNEIRNLIKQNNDDNTDINLENRFSIVKVYEAATTLIGEHPLNNGKTMGLSSYGQNIDYFPLFIDQNPIENYFDQIRHPFIEGEADSRGVVCFNNLEDKIIDLKDLNNSNHQYYANKAKHVQLETQRAALNLIKTYVEKTGVNNVCLVGGYALNIIANNSYIKNLPDVNFYFEPTADDTGTSIGSAMLAYKNITGKYAQPLTDNFYHYYDNTENLEIGESCSLVDICNLLINQKSVAIFDGAPEAGPRALGHRSILFDARNINAKEIVNKIKKREWFRPFAGIILESKFHKYFETLGLNSSPYMTINFDSKELSEKTVPGIIHVDGTCRIQTVNSGFLFELLTLFYEKTGCPIILNTSLNLAGEPLVQTKKDALNVFENSELDALYFVEENRIIIK